MQTKQIGGVLVLAAIFFGLGVQQSEARPTTSNYFKWLAKLNPIVHIKYGECKSAKWHSCARKNKLPKIALKCTQKPFNHTVCRKTAFSKRRIKLTKLRLNRLTKLSQTLKGKKRRAIDIRRSRLIKKLGKYRRTFRINQPKCEAYKICYKLHEKKIKRFKVCYRRRVKNDCYKP